MEGWVTCDISISKCITTSQLSWSKVFQNLFVFAPNFWAKSHLLHCYKMWKRFLRMVFRTDCSEKLSKLNEERKN